MSDLFILPESADPPEDMVLRIRHGRVVIGDLAEAPPGVVPLAAATDALLDELPPGDRLVVEAQRLRTSADYLREAAESPAIGRSWGRRDVENEDGEGPFIPPGSKPGYSDRLSGSVAVGLVMVDGPGSAAYSVDQQKITIAKVLDGLHWLGEQYQLVPVVWHLAATVVEISVEPNPNLPKPDREAAFLDPALAKLGKPPGHDGVDEYARDLRDLWKTDWTYVTFWVNYPVSWFAYATNGAALVVMQYTNKYAKPTDLDRVFAHETGHVFHAPDEYSDEDRGYKCECQRRYGYYDVPNFNCVECGGSQVECIMDGNVKKMCVWTPRHIGTPQWNPAGKKTGSPPALVGDTIVFRGTDGRVFSIGTDGTDYRQLGTTKARSSPFVADGVVYFQSDKDELWRVGLDGTDARRLGTVKIASPPFVADGVVYFQGTDDRLTAIDVDGTNPVWLGQHLTASSPCVGGGRVFFRGTNDALLEVGLDGRRLRPLDSSIHSSPIEGDGYLYYEGPSEQLMRVEVGREIPNPEYLEVKTMDTPSYWGGTVYYADPVKMLWRLPLDGSDPQPIGQNWSKSSPVVVDDVLLFQGTGDELWMVNLT